MARSQRMAARFRQRNRLVDRERMTRPLGSAPTVIGASLLLRVVPPLCPALVLWPWRSPRLGFSLGIGATGSKVPCLSLIRARAAFRPDAATTAYRPVAEALPTGGFFLATGLVTDPGVKMTPRFWHVFVLSTLLPRFTCVRLHGPRLT